MLWNLFSKPDWSEVEKIDDILTSFQKPDFEASKKEAIKSHILISIKNKNTQTAPENFVLFEKKIHKTGISVKLPVYIKTMIKNRVFDYIEKTRNFTWFFKTKFIFKQFVAYALIILLAITGIFSFTEKPFVAVAHPTTVLTEISGDVVVVRAGKVIIPKGNFPLYQNDIIETRNGTATITYFDKSISRLNKNTNIRFSKLYADDSGFNTAVEIDFLNGQAWSMVFDLFNGSFFKVNLNKITADANNTATFSILASKDKAEINVFHNFVDLTLNNNQAEKNVVLKGYKAVVDNHLPQSKLRIVQIPKDKLSFDEREWVEDNIKKDKEYVARIANDQTSGYFAASTPDKLEESFYSSLNVDEKLRVRLNIAENKFLSGEALLNEGKIDEARQNIIYFKQTISDVKSQADALRSSNPDEAKKLIDLIHGKILKYKKALAIIARDSPLYEAKQSLRDIETEIADNDADKVTSMLDSVSSLLLEVQDLADNGKYREAEESLLAAKQIIEELQKFDLSGNQELLKKVIDKKADIVKISTLIEKTSDYPIIKEEAKAVKDSSIQTIINAASSAASSKSIEEVKPAVKELNNFINTYPVDEELNVAPKIQLFLQEAKQHPAPASESSNEKSDISE